MENKIIYGGFIGIMKKELSFSVLKKLAFSLLLVFSISLILSPAKAMAEQTDSHEVEVKDEISKSESKSKDDSLEEQPDETNEQLKNTEEAADDNVNPDNNSSDADGEKIDNSPENTQKPSNENSEQMSPSLEPEDEILKEGSQGPKVIEFKEDLMTAGFADSWTNPNDYFGPETVTYVEEFQASYELKMTGEADEATVKQLNAILRNTYEDEANDLENGEEKEEENKDQAEDEIGEQETTETDQPSDEQTQHLIPYSVQTNDGSLSEGSNNPEVKEFKEDLMAAGFATSWNNPNNNYGPGTVEYVKEFQAYYGLEETGDGDEATLNQLAEVLNSPYQLGESSSEIRELKTQLMHLGFANQWTNPNNNYGPEAVEVVKSFQSYYGLAVNGIIDEVTYTKIMEVTESPFSEGARGPLVTEFKKDLMAAGFATSWTNPNSNYGPETVEYVKEFQTYYGLEATGNGDEATLNKLEEILNNPYQLGESSSEIRELKTQLMNLGFAEQWTNPNNNYGPKTVEIVKDFQSFYGLPVNGIIDEMTYAKINEVAEAPLSDGLNRPDVKQFKEALMATGFATSWTNPNSNYGPETVEYVKEFQVYYGLEVTGDGDEATLNQLEKVLSSPYQLGESSSEIRAFKTELMHLGFADQWTNPNDNYGPETVEVVKNFQAYYGLAVNGIIDSVTAEKMDSLFDSPYRLGASGPEIREIKADLMTLGFGTQWNAPNDNYGPETVEVIKDFQSHYGLAVSGIVDSVTEEKVHAVLNSLYQLGANNSEVQEIKADLMTLGFGTQWNAPNKNYGPETVEVVKDFQEAYNLPMSGIVDEVTLAVIAAAIEDHDNQKKVVYLDPGHGSSDTGAYYGGVSEREINLAVSQKVNSRLKNQGYEVVMSRNSSSNSYYGNPADDLYARADKANEIDADIYVSVHHNAMPGSSTVSGIETYYYGASSNYPPLPENAGSHNDPLRLSRSLELATVIQSELVNATGANARGVKQGAFVVVRETKMPAVLLELGYMTNSTELNRLTSDSYQNTLADAIVRGINRYFNK